MAPPSAELRACLANDSPDYDYCQPPPPLASTDAEFGFRIYDYPAVPTVLQLLGRYEFEALTSIRGTGWLINRAVVPAPGAARLAFELPASKRAYLIDVYTVDGAHMQRCAEQHADELPDQEPFVAYLIARDKVCGVVLRLVVDGNPVAPDDDPYAAGHFMNLGAHLPPDAVHKIAVEAVRGDPRNLRYAVVVRFETQMP